jgi:hypothetical protein
MVLHSIPTYLPKYMTLLHLIGKVLNASTMYIEHSSIERVRGR